jgi:hypothetical protein
MVRAPDDACTQPHEVLTIILLDMMTMMVLAFLFINPPSYI